MGLKSNQKLESSQGVIMVSLSPRGGIFMMSRSGRLKERVVAGRPSAARRIQMTFPILELIRKKCKCCIGDRVQRSN